MEINQIKKSISGKLIDMSQKNQKVKDLKI